MEAMGIVSDLVFAIMPLFFLWSLHRPLTERILLGILMGFGTVAAVAGGMKIYHINAWDPRRDVFRDWVPLLWWYRVEEIGLIIAACAPFLKPTIDQALFLLGSSPFKFPTIGLDTVRSSNNDNTNDTTKTSSTMPWVTGPQDGDDVKDATATGSSSIKWVTGEQHLTQSNPC